MQGRLDVQILSSICRWKGQDGTAENIHSDVPSCNKGSTSKLFIKPIQHVCIAVEMSINPVGLMLPVAVRRDRNQVVTPVLPNVGVVVKDKRHLVRTLKLLQKRAASLSTSSTQLQRS